MPDKGFIFTIKLNLRSSLLYWVWHNLQHVKIFFLQEQLLMRNSLLLERF